jgi:hypothetical protein
MDLVRAQQLRQLRGVDAIPLVAILQQSIPSWIANHQAAETWASEHRITRQPKFLPRKSVTGSHAVPRGTPGWGGLGLQQAFHDQLAMNIHHCHGNGGLMHIQADILLLTHKGAPFATVGDPNNHNLSQKWAPFYIACNRLWVMKKSVFLKTAKILGIEHVYPRRERRL